MKAAVVSMPLGSWLLKKPDWFDHQTAVGLTFAVNLGPGKNGNLGSTGEYFWSGAAGTRFWIDPKEQMFGIFLVQILPHTALTYGQDFRILAFQALAD